MPLDIPTGAAAPASYPLQFINIEITPLVDGEYSVAMQATLLDEEQLEFIGQDLAHEHVKTIEEALAIIRQSVGPLDAAVGNWPQYPFKLRRGILVIREYSPSAGAK